MVFIRESLLPVHGKVAFCCDRQLPALVSTEGRAKVEVLADRLLDINPDLDVVSDGNLASSAILTLFCFTFSC